MEIKKSKKADLESKRAWILQIGFLVTGSLTLAAFTYKNPDALADMQAKIETRPTEVDYVVMEQPKVEQKTQEQQQPQTNDQQTASTVNAQQQASELMTQVNNSNKEPDAQAGVELGNLLAGVDIKVGGGVVPVTPEDEIDNFPKIEAMFPGGYPALQKYIVDNMNYPQEALDWGDEGVVALTFVVEKDGTVSNIEISRGVSKELDREAKRLLMKSPKWIPGENQYEKVRSRVMLPIRFEIGN